MIGMPSDKSGPGGNVGTGQSQGLQQLFANYQPPAMGSGAQAPMQFSQPVRPQMAPPPMPAPPPQAATQAAPALSALAQFQSKLPQGYLMRSGVQGSGVAGGVSRTTPYQRSR